MKFLVLQHLAIEPPALIADIIRAEGHTLRIINLESDPHAANQSAISEWDGLIIMGGPQSANDSHLTSIATALAYIDTAIRQKVPMLGICLGAQLMAKAAGGTIQPSPVRELGWYPAFPTSKSASDPLFNALPHDGLPVFQWHGETFTLPSSATLLASHPEVPHQAFRLNDGQYGLQFHVEVDAAIIQSWINAGNSERAYLGDSGIAEINRQTNDYLDGMQGFCRDMVLNWLQLISHD